MSHKNEWNELYTMLLEETQLINRAINEYKQLEIVLINMKLEDARLEVQYKGIYNSAMKVIIDKLDKTIRILEDSAVQMQSKRNHVRLKAKSLDGYFNSDNV